MATTNGYKKFIKNSFFYGAIGDRLLGQRTSEMYNSSAKEINNMLVTDLGTLKVMKKFNENDFSLNGTLRNVLNTSEGYYVALTTTKLYLLDNDDCSIISSIGHTLESTVNVSIIKKNMVILYDGVNIFQIYKIDDSKQLSQYIDIGLVLPIGNKKEIEMDVWKVSKDLVDTSKLQVKKLDTYTNPKLTIKDNNIYLANSTVKFKRIYVTYGSSIDRNDIKGIADGDIYGILKLYHTVDGDKKYIVGNKNVTIGDLTYDDTYKGSYFTQIISDEEVTGKWMFGTLLDVSKPETVTYYQDRLILGKGGYIFFSEVRNYFNFETEDNEDEDAFYMSVAPINNKRGKLLGFLPSNGLYVITTVGVYIFGIGIRLTNSSIYTGSTIATEMSVSGHYEIVNNILYFTNNSGVLKSLSLNTASTQLSYSTVTVDRYTTNNKYDYLTKMTIEDKEYLIAMREDEDKMYLFTPIGADEGLFRKSSIDYTGIKSNIFSTSEKIFTDKKFYTEGDKNYEHATVFINPPALKGEGVLCDNSSMVRGNVIKLINEDRDGVKGITLDNVNIQNLGENVDDLYSIYSVKIGKLLKTGNVIDIYTNENDKNVELQSVQTSITITENV